MDTGEKYVFIWCGQKKRRDAGVGVLVRECADIIFDEPDITNPRLMAINMQIKGFKVRLVNVYAPTNCDGSTNEKDAFYGMVKKACTKQHKHQKLIITGDFNATTAVSLEKSYFDGRQIINDPICNDNGSRIKGICRELKLCMSQTYFDHPKEKRYTWFSGDGTTKKVLDYVLVEPFVQNYITNCAADPKYDFDSDHRLVKTIMSTPTTKKVRKQSKKENKATSIAKPDPKSLERNDIRTSFITSVSNELNNRVVPPNAESFLVNCLESAAQSTLPKTKRKRSTKEIWKEDILLNELLQRRKVFLQHTDEYKQLTKDVKRRVRHLRNDKLANEAKKINQFSTQRKVQALYRSFKSDNSPFREAKSAKRCDTEKLKCYFKKHFTSDPIDEDPIELNHIPEHLKNLQNIKVDGIKIGPPGEDEIRNVIKKQKVGKAAIDVPMSYIKTSMGIKKFVEEMCDLYTTIWQTKMIPKSWGHSRLVTLWKGPSKGKAENPETYRALQIGSTLCKILIMIIINRINTWYEDQLLDQQQGFRTERGTSDGIFIVKSIQQITNKMKKTVYAVFVDLTAAFDHVERGWVFKSIKNRLPEGFNLELIQLLESLYSNTTTALAETPNDVFQLTAGVRQGGPESPMLYNLYMDHVMRIYLDECKCSGVNFLKFQYKIPEKASSTGRTSQGNLTLDWCGYADDLLLVFDDEESLRNGLRILDQTFRRYRLEINLSKTKTMIFNQQYEDREYPTSIAVLGDRRIENVKMYRYLGSEIRFDEHTTGETEMNLRSDAAECKFYSMAKNLLNMKINVKIRVNMLNSLIRSRITYGCQTWSITKTQLDHMTSVYMSFLRKMTRGGYKRKEDSWSYVLTNNDLLRISKTIDLVTYVKEQQLNYVCKVVRKDNKSIAKQLMFNSDRSRKTGPRTTLLSSVLKNENCKPDDLFRRIMELPK